jgi:WD40 repeat protein
MGTDANPPKEFVPADYAFSTEKDISGLKASPDNTMLAVGYGKENIRLYDVEQMNCIEDLQGCCFSDWD